LASLHFNEALGQALIEVIFLGLDDAEEGRFEVGTMGGD
jgi:hypothetical protein